MAEAPYVGKEVCDAFRESCGQRTARDEQRFQSLEDMQKQFLTLQGQLAEILKNQTKQLDGHETRIRTLEDNPKQWLDRIIGGAIAAIIAAAVSFITNVGRS